MWKEGVVNGSFNFFRGNKNENNDYKKATYEKGPFMITCPFCFKKFKTDQVVFRASHYENGDPEYEKNVDELLNEYNKKVGKGILGEINPIIIPKGLPEKNKVRVDGGL